MKSRGAHVSSSASLEKRGENTPKNILKKMEFCASGQFKAVVMIQNRSPFFWHAGCCVPWPMYTKQVVQRKNLHFLVLGRVLRMGLDKTSDFSTSSPCFTVKCKVCCLAKQQRSATASRTVLVKHIQPEEPSPTGKFTARNTRAIDCFCKATRLAA